MQSDKVLNLPAGYFGIVLGTIGMGFAWRYASQLWQVSHWLGDGLVILAMIIWGLLTGAFITRLIRFPHSVLAEVRHPVLSSFVSLFPAIYRYSLASCRVYAMIAMATAPAGEILSFTLIFRQKSSRHGKC